MAFDRKYSFEDFVEAARKVRSPEQLFSLLVETMNAKGFDRVNFSIARDDDVPARAQGFGLISTYPAFWQSYYNDRNLAEIDPVLRCATSTFRPFQWRELERTLPLSRRQRSFLREGEEAGLHNGLGIPFNGPRGQIAGIALATSSKIPGHANDLAVIAAYCDHFYAIYKSLVGKKVSSAPPVAILTKRELEILVRVAHGRTDAQIAQSLTITSDTVDFHLRNIFVKLQVNNRTAAAVWGLNLRLFDL